MITVEYRCADGSPFPVTFRDEVQAATPWHLDRAHGRDPQTPLGGALMRAGLPGTRRAYEELGLPVPSVFDDGPDAGGFPYFDTSLSPEYLEATTRGCARLVEEHGSALGIWHRYCLPRTKQACDDLGAAGLDADLCELAAIYQWGQNLTMIPAFVCGNDLLLLTAAIGGAFGEQAGLVAYELTQGFPSDTLQADQRLWELGRLAADDADVLECFSAGDVATAMTELRAAGRAPRFFAGVDEYLGEYGHRAEGWDIACPTWNERRAGFWAQVAQMASDVAPEPAQVLADAAVRRDALVAEVEARLADDESALARFRRRITRIEPYVAVREERARWQVAAVGELRGACLRQGRALAEQGRIAEAEDVLFLLPDEIRDGASDLRDVVASRREEHLRRCGLEPPEVIGGEAPPAAQPSFPVAADHVLHGVSVARGVASGRARVVVDLEDADRLEPGDILVCVMTSPPWTPLFGLASAVVAETGDLGSHPAIAAREYGIAGVLGVRRATRVIPDGAMVTVDGSAGTVRILT